MGRSGENKFGAIGPSRVRGGVRRNSGRALAAIDQNIMGASVHPVVVKNRGITENVICEKNSLIVGHGPITRKVAAQMDRREQYSIEERRQPGPSAPNEIKDSTIVDVEYTDAFDTLVPMFVKHTESILDDIDDMEESETEDIEEEHIDIDIGDTNDTLAVVEYVGDIYAYYREVEISSCASPNYMSFQWDINEKMRAILIDWLIEVHYKFELLGETLFLTVNLIDRFLEKQTVVRKKLQLVGVTAMLLACKYEEVSVPILDDFIHITANAYTRDEVIDMEKSMVNTLQFNMSVPTPYQFMRRYLKAAQADTKRLEHLSFFIMELCLVEYEMLRFLPSLLAASAIYTAQCSLSGFIVRWSVTSEWYSSYSEDQLLECSKLMVGFHGKAGTGKLNGVYKKYSATNFGSAARYRPAQFLLGL